MEAGEIYSTGICSGSFSYLPAVNNCLLSISNVTEHKSGGNGRLNMPTGEKPDVPVTHECSLCMNV